MDMGQSRKGSKPNHVDLFDLTSFGYMDAAGDYPINFLDPRSVASKVVQDVPMRTAWPGDG